MQNGGQVFSRIRQNLSDKENFPFVVVGNKSDLTTERQVTHEMVESWCKELGDLHYVETSAKDGSGVYEAFLMAAKKYSEVGPRGEELFDWTQAL